MAGESTQQIHRSTDRGGQNINLEKTRCLCFDHASHPIGRRYGCVHYYNQHQRPFRTTQQHRKSLFVYTRVAGDLNLHNFSKRLNVSSRPYNLLERCLIMLKYKLIHQIIVPFLVWIKRPFFVAHLLLNPSTHVSFPDVLVLVRMQHLLYFSLIFSRWDNVCGYGPRGH